MNDIIRELTKKLYMRRLSDYVDFPSLIRVIAVLNCQNELRIAWKELIGTSPKMHFERFVTN